MSTNYDAASGGGFEPLEPSESRQMISGKIEAGGKQVVVGGKAFEAEKLNPSTTPFGKAKYEGHFFSPDKVIITINDSSSKKLVRVGLKIRDVAAFLGVDKRRVESYISEGNLEEYMTAESRVKVSVSEPDVEKPPPVARGLETPEAVSPEVRRETIPKLDRYEFSTEEYDKICQWYESKKADLFDEGVNRHLKKEQTGLPITVIFIADGPHKGLHVRSKVTVGTGSFNKAVRALHVDTGIAKVARAAKEEHAPQSEIDRNREYAALDPTGTYFATGAPIKHKGLWKDRAAISRELGKGSLPGNISGITSRIPQERDVDKVTFIMDEIPGGELAEGFYENPLMRVRKPTDYIPILLHLNQGLVIAHKAGKIDIDYKAENIFMDGEIPKMADFGMAHNVGDVITQPKGTPGFIPPEILRAGPATPLTIQAGNQMWIQGCIMAIMFKGMEFDNWNGQADNSAFYRVCDQVGLASAIDTFFPDNKTEGSLDWCIAQCLQFNPEDRISAEALQPHLERIYRAMTTS